MLKIDGEKIYKEDYEKLCAQFSKQKQKKQKLVKNQVGKDYKGLPKNVIEAQILSSQINDAINKLLIKKLDVTVSKREIYKKFKEFEKSNGVVVNIQLLLLNARGIKIEDFRNQLKEFALNEKKIEAIKSKNKNF